MCNLVIKVHEGETVLSPGDFWRKKQNGFFVKMEEDKDDSIKLMGQDSNGNVFVSEKIDDEMSDIELKDYYENRKGVSMHDIINNSDFDVNTKELYFSSSRGVVN